jgi:hypothetical protein
MALGTFLERLVSTSSSRLSCPLRHFSLIAVIVDPDISNYDSTLAVSGNYLVFSDMFILHENPVKMWSKFWNLDPEDLSRIGQQNVSK